MKVPYVKVNNQKEFERVVAKMEKETGLKAWKGLLGIDDVYNIVGVDKDNEIMLFNSFNPYIAKLGLGFPSPKGSNFSSSSITCFVSSEKSETSASIFTVGTKSPGNKVFCT